MIREIVQYGHPVLRHRCRPVTQVDDYLIELVADMSDNVAHGMGVEVPNADVAAEPSGDADDPAS